MKTFVVRLFVPAGPVSDQRVEALHGLVEEIGSERRAPFAGGRELLGFIAATGRDGRAADATPQRKERT